MQRLCLIVLLAVAGTVYGQVDYTDIPEIPTSNTLTLAPRTGGARAMYTGNLIEQLSDLSITLGALCALIGAGTCAIKLADGDPGAYAALRNWGMGVLLLLVIPQFILTVFYG